MDFFQDAIVQEISKGSYGKYYVISHVMCDLWNTENDTEKSPNFIEYYETAKKNFTAGYIFIREKVRYNTVLVLLTSTKDDIQNQRRKSRE